MDKLKERFEGIVKTLRIVIRCFHIARSLTITEDVQEHQAVMDSRFLRVSRTAYFYIAIVELVKLIEKRKDDEYNLHKFFENIRSNLRVIDRKPSVKEIDAWQKSLLSINTESQKKIRSLRDELFAHLDPKAMDNNYLEYITPTLDETEKVIITIRDIVFNIGNNVFGEHLVLDNRAEKSNGKDHIKTLIKYKYNK